ncbi:MAG TPA: class I SAM-dependent methyltransferase [Usitatibacter sp.]|nr:class I SAM-dependent methyltransferase [Usitatibacter sp.]
MAGGAQDAAGLVVWRALPPLRARLLEHWITGGTRLGAGGRWLFTGLSHALDAEYYGAATTTRRREAIKALCMGEDSGVRWAKEYLKRGFPDPFTPLIAMFGELEARLAAGAVARVHQVACCSGREIAHFARRYPRVAFTGSDADPSIVEFLRDTWRELPNLSFAVVKLDEPGEAGMESMRGDVVFASGGLHYLDPDSLRRLFAGTRSVAGAFLLSQPLARDYASDGPHGSSPRGQLSWNHPYPRYLREAGWKRVSCSEGKTEELLHVKNVSVSADAV